MGKKLMSVIFLILTFLVFNQCRIERDSGDENPIPRLNAVSPGSMTARMPSFSLTAEGIDFVPGSKIVFNGIEKETAFIDFKTLTCQIDPDDIVFSAENSQPGPAAGTNGASIPYVQDQTVGVVVRNPSPGGGYSDSVEFIIKANPPFKTARTISHYGFSGLSPLSVSYFNGPSLTVDGDGKMNALWETLPYTDNEPGIYFNDSTDYGVSWCEPVKIHDNHSKYTGRAVSAVDASGNIGVVWNEFPADANPDILFCGSRAGGVNWSSPVNISNNPGFSENPAIAMDNDSNIYVVWEDYDFDLEKQTLFFSRSLAQGESSVPGVDWSSPVAVAPGLTSPQYPDITVDAAGYVYIACTNQDTSGSGVYFMGSTDGGDSWSSPVSACCRGAMYPVGIAVNNSGHMVIVGCGRYDTFVVRSSDGGLNWTEPLSISSDLVETWSPAAAVDGIGNFCLVWTYLGPGKSDIYFTRSVDNGAAWSTPANVSNIDKGSITMADIAAGPLGNIAIAWIYLDEDINKWTVDFTSTDLTETGLILNY